MIDFEELAFMIPAYTSETMPLDRLLQYLRQIGDVLGAAHDLHLIRIDPSSTKPVFGLRTPAAVQARACAQAVSGGHGTRDQRAAFSRIRQMVREDGGDAANLSDRTGVILEFPAATGAMGEISGVRQVSHFDGVVQRVGGSGDPVPVLMEDLSGGVVSGFTAPRHLAKDIARLLFEPVRLSGIGHWDRDAAGEWTLSKMLIQACEPLSGETLGQVVQRLRAAPVQWPDDADDVLRHEREDVT